MAGRGFRQNLRMAAALVGGTIAVGLGWTLAGLNKGPQRLTPSQLSKPGRKGCRPLKSH